MKDIAKGYDFSAKTVYNVLVRNKIQIKPGSISVPDDGLTVVQRGYKKTKADPTKYKDYVDKHYKKSLKRYYGLTPEFYNEIKQLQKDRCAICKEIPTKRLRVDHDHKTNSFRGLLCDNCNRALGYFKDNVSNLESAVNYLETRLV